MKKMSGTICAKKKQEKKVSQKKSRSRVRPSELSAEQCVTKKHRGRDVYTSGEEECVREVNKRKHIQCTRLEKNSFGSGNKQTNSTRSRRPDRGNIGPTQGIP